MAMADLQQHSFRESTKSHRHHLGFEVATLCIVQSSVHLVVSHHPTKLSYNQGK